MQSSDNDQDLLKRLRELEEENARLRNSPKSSKITITEGEYKGHPTLTFEGPFRSFTLGLTKLSVIKETWPQIEVFLERHVKAQANDTQKHDDVKI